jgi:uncharacterized membrane protein
MSGKAPPGPYGFDNLPQPLPLRAYQNMAIVLRTGLLLTVILFVSGLALFFVVHPGESLSTLFSSKSFLRFLDPGALFNGLGHGDPAAILTLGMLVLVATPMARVLTGMIYFHEHGELDMSLVTLVVLTLLLVGALLLGPFLAHL